MKVSCQSCGATYAIADDKVKGRLVKVRCKSCHNPIVVDGRQAQPEAQASPAAPAHAQPAVASVPAPPPEPSPELWSVNLSETDSRTMSVQEIMVAFQRGEMAEAFVWKDGMADWKPLLEVPELQALLESKALSQPPAYDFGVKPHTVPGSTAYAETAPADAAKPAAARVAGARGQSQDLFGAVDRAGSEEEAQHGASADAGEPHKLTGARNENSVLFSLDALKAGLVGQASGAKPAAAAARPAAPKPPSAAKPPGRPPTPSAPVIPGRPTEKERQLDDVMNIGGGNALFSMGADQALLTAPAPPEPKPEPKPVLSTAGGLAASAVYAQAPPPRKTFLMVALAGVFGLMGVGGAVAAVIMSNKTKADLAAKTEVSAPVASVASAAPAKTAESPASAAPAPAESVAQAGADAGAQAPAAPARPLTEEEKKKYAEMKKKAEEEKAKKTEKDEAKEKKETEAKVAAAGFDKNAAVSALTSAASAASACKRPDGPTGAGKVSVTFAPSGRATNAVISGGSFAGTSVGGCIASVFRRARVPAFSGDPVTVSKSFSISP